MDTAENMNGFVAFIRERRSKEAAFDDLYARFEKEGTGLSAADAIRNKADVYRQAKQVGGTAWPEFEGFVTELEKAVMQQA